MNTIWPKGHKPGDDSSGTLFDTLRREFACKTDMELAEKVFGMDRAAICRVRLGKQAVTERMIITAAEKTGRTTVAIKKMIAKPRFPANPPQGTDE